MPKIAALILAGGKGTRMNTDTPKVLHLLAGKPMIYYTFENLRNSGIKDIYVCLSYKAGEVKKELKKMIQVKYTYQHEPTGTGHAVGCSLPLIDENIEDLLVINGDDSAFYTTKTLQNFLNTHLEQQAVVSMMVLKLEGENEFGKVIKNSRGEFKALVERDRFDELNENVQDINCGAYIFDRNWLAQNINKIQKNKKDELNITEMFNIAVTQEKKVNLYNLENSDEWVGINTVEELEYANQLMKKRRL